MLFRTDANAILGIAALVDSAVAHHRFQTLRLQCLPCRMQIEETDLIDNGCPHEARFFVICGHTSRHKQHEMQRERGYACSCTAGVTRGPGPKS